MLEIRGINARKANRECVLSRGDKAWRLSGNDLRDPENPATARAFGIFLAFAIYLTGNLDGDFAPHTLEFEPASRRFFVGSHMQCTDPSLCTPSAVLCSDNM